MKSFKSPESRLIIYCVCNLRLSWGGFESWYVYRSHHLTCLLGFCRGNLLCSKQQAGRIASLLVELVRDFW